jgi:hypothetical protein
MDPVMTLLRDGVPITLLLDLADPAGPRSREIYDRERPLQVTVERPLPREIHLHEGRFAPALA